MVCFDIIHNKFCAPAPHDAQPVAGPDPTRHRQQQSFKRHIPSNNNTRAVQQ